MADIPHLPAESLSNLVAERIQLAIDQITGSETPLVKRSRLERAEASAKVTARMAAIAQATYIELKHASERDK